MMEDNRPNLDYLEDSEAPDNVVSAASLMATSSNSNVFDANDSMALNESSIQNVLEDSVFRNSAFPTTMQMSRSIFILSNSFITPKEADEFYEQALRSPNLKINECMSKTTIELLDIKVMTDARFSMMPKNERHNWKTALSVIKVATLIVQYFGIKMDSARTLAENFAKIPFHYSLETHEFELRTFMAYKTLVLNHERSSSIVLSDAQHKELILIIEKRLPIGSRIQSDYVAAKRMTNNSVETWHEAMNRLLEVLENARKSISRSKSYGPTNVVYSFPSSAVPPMLTSLEGKAEPLVHLDPVKAITLKKMPLNIRVDTSTPQLVDQKACRSCGSKKHLLAECPVLYYSDANNDHQTDWHVSTLGKAWLLQGYTEWQIELELPGYEDRKLLMPKGTKPFMMGDSNKRARHNNASEGVNNNNNNNYNGNNNMGNPRRFQGQNNNNNNNFNNNGNNNNNNYNNNGNFNNNNRRNNYQGQNYNNQNNNNIYGQQSQNTVRFNAPQGQQNPTLGGTPFDCNDIVVSSNEMFISAVSVPVEFLHDSSTNPSQYLNMTVFVQDKQQANPRRERRAAAKAVLDTANFAADFISFSMIVKLDAIDACYEAPQAITICSGLDNHCYLNNQVIDVGIRFHSYDNVCNTIYLTLRVNQRSSIEILLGRETVNKYNFMSLTPFAFGITPKQLAQNKLENDIRRREFETKDAIDRLDPMYMHKYTRRMIFEGPVPKMAEQKSITPHYDEFMQSKRTFKNCSKDETDEESQSQIEDILHATLKRKSHVSCLHAMPTKTSGCRVNFDGVMTEEICGCESCKLLNSVTPILAKRTGDTPHLGGDSIPTLLQAPEDLAFLDYDTEAVWPCGIKISVDEIDNEKTDTFDPFLPDKTCRDVPPKRPEDFLSQITFEGDESLQEDLRLLCLKYSDIFSDELDHKPADLEPFRLDVNRDKWERTCNRGPVRPQSSKKEVEIDKALKQMLESGVIERSDAVYYSHPVIVNKTADTYRFCIDYRKLNECIEPASFPLPNIKNLFERIGNRRPDTFGVMDLTSGYHQAPLHAAHRIFTAFLCFAGVYHFTRLPFGPCRAPSYFQEQMATKVLYGLIYISCEMYLDDCIVFGRGNAEFLFRLEEVFKRFRSKNLRLKAKKCKFGLPRIEYVGKVVDKNGLSMSAGKIETVLNFPLPKDVTALRGLLGLANFFRGFVPFHSDMVKPLQKMADPKAAKKSQIVWTPEGIKAFNDTKIAISRCPLMHFLDEVSPIKLYTDASDYGIGGILFQIVNNIWKPIAFVSKSLSSTQINWSTIQKESYAIFYCCQQLDSLIRDRKFTIHTDHMNITYMKQNPCSMVARWFIAMQELDFSIHFVKGSDNQLADAMSRLCPNLTHIALPLTSEDDMANSSVSSLMVITQPTDEQLEAIQMCHNSIVGHSGVDRTLTRLFSLQHAWKHMKQHVRNFIKICACCQKMSSIAEPMNVNHYSTSTYSIFDTLNIDFLGPFPDKGYVLVIIDTFTRWTELFWCPDATAKSACDGLLHHFGRYGSPNMIRSDRGSHFANELIKDFLDLTGTPHNMTLAYSSQENAIVERVNKEVNRHLRALTFETQSLEGYKKCLPFVQRIINGSVNERTGASPAKLLFGNKLDLNRGIITPFLLPEEVISNSKYVTDLVNVQDEVLKAAVESLSAAENKRLGKNTKEITVFPIDSYVLAKYNDSPPTRLHTKWHGPFRVVSYIDSEYIIANLITHKERSVHLSSLKQFYFDPAIALPADTARRDYMEFFVEKILAHAGDNKKPTSMSFHVKWLNYDDSHNTWEPWKSLRLCDALHDYLRNNNMTRFIPKNIERTV